MADDEAPKGRPLKKLILMGGLGLIVLGALMVPFQVTFITVYVMTARLNWLNTFQGLIIYHVLCPVLTVKAPALGYNKNNGTLWHIIENNLRQPYFDSCILCSNQPYLYIFRTGFNQTVSTNPNLR